MLFLFSHLLNDVLENFLWILEDGFAKERTYIVFDFLLLFDAATVLECGEREI